MLPPMMFLFAAVSCVVFGMGATVEWLIWLLCNLVVFLCHDC